MTEKTPDPCGSDSSAELGDTTKAAESRAYQRAYQRGYQAGQRRKAKEINAEKYQAQKDAFRRRAFLAALPACVTAVGWKKGEKPINNIDARTELAWDFANEALKRY
jgi:ribosome modulation factor